MRQNQASKRQLQQPGDGPISKKRTKDQVTKDSEQKRQQAEPKPSSKRPKLTQEQLQQQLSQ